MREPLDGALGATHGSRCRRRRRRPKGGLHPPTVTLSLTEPPLLRQPRWTCSDEDRTRACARACAPSIDVERVRGHCGSLPTGLPRFLPCGLCGLLRPAAPPPASRACAAVHALASAAGGPTRAVNSRCCPATAAPAAAAASASHLAWRGQAVRRRVLCLPALCVTAQCFRGVCCIPCSHNPPPPVVVLRAPPRGTPEPPHRARGSTLSTTFTSPLHGCCVAARGRQPAPGLPLRAGTLRRRAAHKGAAAGSPGWAL